LGINVLKVYNALYTENDYGIVYSDQMKQERHTVTWSMSKEYK